MKLTVDTKHDSIDEIKRAIRLLNSIVDEQGSNYGTSTDEPVKEGILTMFGDDMPSNQEQTLTAETSEQPAPELKGENEKDGSSIVPYS
jgi:hypothetical protein